MKLNETCSALQSGPAENKDSEIKTNDSAYLTTSRWTILTKPFAFGEEMIRMDVILKEKANG